MQSKPFSQKQQPSVASSNKGTTLLEESKEQPKEMKSKAQKAIERHMQGALLKRVLSDDVGDKVGHINRMKTINRKKDNACLGIVRLDYTYPAAPGDMDCAATFEYDVFYRMVPGLTFDMCQGGIMSRKVQKEFNKVIDFLVNKKKVSGISGDCGFMMWF